MADDSDEKINAAAPGRFTPPDLPRLSRKARYARGKALRLRTPRSAHADEIRYAPRNAVAILAGGDRTRVPELIDERYRRMLVSPFTFLRGAAAVMARDLAHHPMAGLAVQAAGDAHLMNFGAFATPEDNILFDLNDFDETLGGVDFTVDLKRLVASVAVAGTDAGLSRRAAARLAGATAAAYRLHMADLAELSPLDVWHSRIDLESEVKAFSSGSLRKKLKKIIAVARGAGLEADDQMPSLVPDAETRRIADKPPAIFHLDPDGDRAHRFDAEAAFSAYVKGLAPERAALVDNYRLVDLAFKAVGVGSVGTFCVVGLFVDGDGDPLFLQVKEAGPSVLTALGTHLAYPGNEGQRVVEGQRIMQAASDIFLGSTADPASGRQFYVRRLKNRRLGSVSELAEEESLGDYARLCGRTLARAHARSADAATLSGYMGRSDAFDSAMAAFALTYAEQSAADLVTLRAARPVQGPR